MAKTRVTFRINGGLAAALRQLPNQTLFVETALLEALGESCPLCEGRGTVSARSLRISDFKAAALPRLGSGAAPRLRELVHLGRRLMATDLRLARAGEVGALAFEILRRNEVLLSGRINARSATEFSLH